LYKGYNIAVSIPAYNEELLISETLEGIPDYVDKIFVVNDASKDKTLEKIKACREKDSRIKIINHEKNLGLGQSLIDGYVYSKNNPDIHITAVMAGDNQMHPDDLALLLDKMIEKELDYVKGNRLLHQNIDSMPKHRFFGNAFLTIMTKFATGYYSLMDPQCGYTIIKNSALKNIPIEKMTKGYGYNADILCMLNIERFKVSDQQVRPVYDREKSKIKLYKYVPKTSWLLTKLFFRRLWKRYIVLDFHPLIMFYLFALLNILIIIIPFTIRFFYYYCTEGKAPTTTLIILIFSILMTFQSILFAIWMDMDYNKKLNF
jgi:glycosyltransferase involved in cell wall biosynthesis